ncbi:MAG: tetratricopeptide repeat protein [Thiothrix litoralis]|uniref:tetratricopeptide repeat protein n=1 Tax=Thiothrix litoralis TaxID=2891210 RepID=UPI003C782955
MHILRWLMKHPIMLAWLLAIVAILLNFGISSKQGDEHGEVAAGHDAAQVVAGEHAQAAPAAEAAAPVVEAPAQQAAAPVAQATTPTDLLRAAREAYWANELDRAIALYIDVLKQAPDSLEYKGELANVYWKQGNSQQAATLFTEIAPQLAAQGRTTEALNMKLYVDMVSPELAKQIDAALKN